MSIIIVCGWLLKDRGLIEDRKSLGTYALSKALSMKISVFLKFVRCLNNKQN
jgi:hypothetical protein